MKDFVVKFYASHARLSNRYVRIRMQGASLERILPRIKKIEALLNKLPNPHEHQKWICSDIDELNIKE